MSIRSTIINQFELVAKDQKQRLPTLSDELVLLEKNPTPLAQVALHATEAHHDESLDPGESGRDNARGWPFRPRSATDCFLGIYSFMILLWRL